ncbi:hypothetical protein DFH07DRAFT_784288 [Mycena maculata]|uniref:Uncharacterized protein n=1 Tax=Mycena maculata TaxID=230809 RepID=A0AAD7HHB4_9AGAR|nr:hypothetical protein DFH07DRAFT_784288 [Mycena maculata]
MSESACGSPGEEIHPDWLVGGCQGCWCTTVLKMHTMDVDDTPADIIDLATFLLSNFDQFVDLPNLQAAILLYQQTGEGQRIKSLSVLWELYTEQPKYVSCLCAALLAGQETPRMTQAFVLFSKARESDTEAMTLARAGNNVLALFQQTQQDSNLHMAISILEAAANKLSWGHYKQGDLMIKGGARLLISTVPSKPLDTLELFKEPNEGQCLNNLACVLHDRFKQGGKMEDLEHAIALQREGVDLFSPPEPDQLSCLANWLHEQFEIMGEGDLNTIIKLHQEALDLLTSADPHHVSSLIGLSDALQKRFQASSDLADLDDCIRLNRKALGICSDTHPNRGPCLNNLANSLVERFQTLRECADLEDAIKHHREALVLFPALHPKHGMSLMNLVKALDQCFETNGELADLNSCIDLSYEAMCLPHLEPDSLLNSLAALLQKRFRYKP